MVGVDDPCCLVAQVGVAEDPAAVGGRTRGEVSADRAAANREIAKARVDPAAEGRVTRGGVAADRAAGDRQIAIARGDPAAVGIAPRVELPLIVLPLTVRLSGLKIPPP